MKKILLTCSIILAAPQSISAEQPVYLYIISPLGQGAYVMIDPAQNTHACMGDEAGNIVCRW